MRKILTQRKDRRMPLETDLLSSDIYYKLDLSPLAQNNMTSIAPLS